jgi:hypothetical protein
MTKFAFALLLLAGSMLTYAQDKPRHINFTEALTGLDGKPIVQGDPKKAEPITLGDIAVASLENSLEEDRQMSGDAKFKLDTLARKIYKMKDAILTVEDISTIKQRIGKAYPPVIVGAAWRLLDPAQQ